MILNLEVAGRPRKVEIVPGSNPGTYTVRLDDEEHQVNALMLEPGVLSLIINGHAYRCILQTGEVESAVILAGQPYPYRIDDPRSLRWRRARADVADGVRPIKASMPGRVVRVLVAVGEQVEAQQGIVIIEAMKMQNELKAPKAGRVTELRVAPGEAVASGQVLAMVE